MARNTTIKPYISVVIPALNESSVINGTIRRVREAAPGNPIEIVVADGDPYGSTLAALEDRDVVGVLASPGRGVQINAGAAVATGDILLFLHADTVLPDGWADMVSRAMAGRAVAGAFSLSMDSPRFGLALIAFFTNLRSRLERIPYGDQAQFIKAKLFRDLGGYAAIPIMEDVELFRRIRRKGLPITVLHGKVVTSARRWEHEGTLRRTVTNWWLRIRYEFGASPDSLVKHYRPHGHEADD